MTSLAAKLAAQAAANRAGANIAPMETVALGGLPISQQDPQHPTDSQHNPLVPEATRSIPVEHPATINPVHSNPALSNETKNNLAEGNRISEPVHNAQAHAAGLEQPEHKEADLMKFVPSMVEAPKGSYIALKLHSMITKNGARVLPTNGYYIAANEEESELLKYYDKLQTGLVQYVE